jgi:uncharacterized protein YqhQ
VTDARQERRVTSDSHDTPPAVSGFDHSGGRVHYGGQAVIEGVMMRGPTAVATAVRLPDGEISVHREPFVSASRRHRILRLPLLRGGLTLIESLSLGIKALNYSAAAAIDSAAESDGGATEAAGAPAGAESGPPEEAPAEARERAGEAARSRPGWTTNLALTGTMVLALGLGVVIFFWIPMMLSAYLTDVIGTKSGILFNLIDGLIRVIFFLAYIWGISRWKEMRRVFEYHGAEHKTIFTEEAGEELTPENARRFTTRHPRCGTSFLLIVMVVSILVFMIFGRPPTIGLRLARLLLIPVIAGISYEVMKLSAKYSHQAWARALSGPGMWLQRITTREPTDEQVEVAIAALEAVRVKPGDDREAAVGQE